MEILARMGRVDEALDLLDRFIATNDTIKNVEVNARFDELRTQYEVENILPRKSVISITSFLLLPFVWFSLCSWQALSITTGLLPSRIVSCMNELKNKTG